MAAGAQLVMRALAGLPDVGAGDDLADLIQAALAREAIALVPGDILVLAHKIVSKAEARLVRYAEVTPGAEALRLAAALRRDPRRVELILRESRAVVRAIDRPGLPEGILITEHRLGFISANACVDESNIGENEAALLLPEDPDRSARALRARLEAAGAAPIGIVIADTFGRPWRIGHVNVAIGLAGVPPSLDLVGQKDAYGRTLRVTRPAFADELAAAAGLLMPKHAKRPVVLCRGLDWTPVEASARDLIRPRNEDLFL
jgi:coenzyme F420-0:L-glutamate ligase/coenzyme F420-1:gamma-L-glutamate ligase